MPLKQNVSLRFLTCFARINKVELETVDLGTIEAPEVLKQRALDTGK